MTLTNAAGLHLLHVTACGNENNAYCRWEAAALFSSPDHQISSGPLTSDHDTQRPMWRQERDAQRLEVPLVHGRPRRRRRSGRDAAAQH